jgi:hypothetical protein
MKQITLFLALLLPTLVFAQGGTPPGGYGPGSSSGSSSPLTTGNITTSGADCSVATSCVTATLPANTQRAAISLSGQFVATLAFEASGDSGLTWFQTPTSSSANGTTTIAVAAETNVRVRASAFTSGPVTVAIYASSNGIEVSPAFTGPIATNGSTSTSGQQTIYGGGSGSASLSAQLNAGNPAALLLPNVTAPPNGTFGLVSDANPAGQTLSWLPVAGLATTPTNNSTVASDTFIRANGGLGANWTAIADAFDTGTMTITTNSVAPNGSVSAASFWSGAGSFSTTQFSQVTINGAGNGTFLGPAVLASASGYYACNSSIATGGNNTQFYIYRVNGGARTIISWGQGVYGGAVATGAVLKLVQKNPGGLLTSAAPASLICYLNGTQVAQVYGDTTFTTGSPGIAGFGNVNNMTAWSGGNQANCTPGQWAYDASFVYFCTSADAWERAAIATF